MQRKSLDMRKSQLIRSALCGKKIRGEIPLSKQPQDYREEESTSYPDHPLALTLHLSVEEGPSKTGLVLSRLEAVLTDVLIGTSKDSIIDCF
jgi:hypothetical protein